MNTAILYSKKEDITEKSFLNKIRAITQLISLGDSVSLIQIDDTDNINAVIGKAVKNNKILFITDGVVEENNSKLSKYFKDDNFGVYKKCTFAVLEKSEGKFFGTLAHILCNNSNEEYSYGYLDVTEKSLQDVKSTLSSECLFSNPTLYTVEFDNYVRVFVLSKASTVLEAEELCHETMKNLKMIFSGDAYSNHFDDLATTVVNLLCEHNLKVATAESCTAGLISSCITSVPGSSAVFEIGISSYADRIKQAALGVSGATLKKYGAVSMQTAAEMAKGIRLLSDSDIGIAATGVAGPGCSENKPVGTVYIALTDGKRNWVVDLCLDSKLTREEIRNKTAFCCLDLLRRYLQCLPEVLPDGADIKSEPFLLYELPRFTANVEFTPEPLNNDMPIVADNVKVLEEDEITAISDEPLLTADEIGFSVNTDFIDENDTTTQESTDITAKFKYVLSKIKDFGVLAYAKAKSFFANKEKVKKLVVNSIFAVIIASILIGSLTVYTYFSAINKNNALITDLQSSWSFSGVVNADGKYSDFDDLKSINKDISGWLKVGNDTVNLPVCYSTNSDFYNNHNYKKQNSRFGALYFKVNPIGDQLGYANNTVIFGNSPTDDSMFASLHNYKSFDYLKENPRIELVTENQHKYYQIFAVMIVDQENLDGFNYSATNFANQRAFEKWLDEARIRSLYNLSEFPVEFNTITLVTETNEFSTAKLIVIGYEVDKFNATYQSLLSVNPTPYYPNAWYDAHNSTNPFGTEKPTPSPITNPLPNVPSVDVDIPIIGGDNDDTSSDTTSSNNTTSGTTSGTSSGGTTSGTSSGTTSSGTTSSGTTSSGNTSSGSTSSGNTSSNTTSSGGTTSEDTPSNDTTSSGTTSPDDSDANSSTTENNENQ